MNFIEKKLDYYGLDKEFTIGVLRDIEYEYIQYKLTESLEEQATIHPRLSEMLHCIHSVIRLMEE